jgi:thiol-disulfide isomerase/thioredoxin
MVRNSNMSNTSQFFLNPLVHVILFILFIIIILAIFRASSPVFSAGISGKAHIGGLKGGFELEAFDNQDPSNQPCFVMYFAEWCGHCKNTMPEFNKLMESPPQGVKILKIDSEDKQNSELLKSQNIKGFPTIRFYPKGLNAEHEEYEGERTHGGFMNFFRQHKL